MPTKKSKNRYRIRRVDQRNVSIQKKVGKEWVVISYHGNNLNSLSAAIRDLAVSYCFPEGDDLPSSLADLASQFEEMKAQLDAQIMQIVPMTEGAKRTRNKTYSEFSLERRL